jgi:hypothetical protein
MCTVAAWNIVGTADVKRRAVFREQVDALLWELSTLERGPSRSFSKAG